MSHDISQLIKLLHTVKALVSNQSLYLEPKPYVSYFIFIKYYYVNILFIETSNMIRYDGHTDVNPTKMLCSK